jgi:hypothetical protein
LGEGKDEGHTVQEHAASTDGKLGVGESSFIAVRGDGLLIELLDFDVSVQLRLPDLCARYHKFFDEECNSAKSKGESEQILCFRRDLVSSDVYENVDCLVNKFCRGQCCSNTNIVLGVVFPLLALVNFDNSLIPSAKG